MVKTTNSNDADWVASEAPGKFGFERKWLSGSVEPCGLGASLYRVAPGECAFPFHMHYAIDEALWIQSGTGTLRYGDEEQVLRAGDYVALPKGTGKAHQLINTGDEPLVYLCVSTMVSPDVVIYPDSDKLAAFDFRPDDERGKHNLVEILQRTPAGYYDGEVSGEDSE